MTDADPLDDLTEDFARRWRDGEQPTVEEYAARHPQWADELLALLPAVLLMERFKPRRDDAPNTLPAPPGAAPSMPERLGEYRLLREIGRGGMGVVYEARQETLGRRVAIKVLSGNLFADEKHRARFRRESQAAARLHHTNIVPVFDVGEQDGLLFYVMQLIAARCLDAPDGGTAPTLERPSAAVPAPAPARSHREVARVGVQAADALAYAHDQGVLHRDVKPSNLLLDEHGTVWITDFGVAKVAEDVKLTGSGEVVGTLRYMPPERFAGHSDARGDVYSLGITLYELFARRPAFPDTTPQQLIRLITHAEPPPLRKVDPAIPPDLETIVFKAAARDPADRYQTAAELADDLRRFLDDRPIRARRTGAVEQLWRWCRRNRLVAGLAAAAVALLLLTSVVSLFAKHVTDAANSDLKNALSAEQQQRERAENTSAAALAALNRLYDHFGPNRIIVAPSLPADGSAEEGIDIPAQPVLPPDAVPLLEELLGFYEQFAREGGDLPRLQDQAAEAEQRIGDIRQRLGQLEPAIGAYRKAIELYTRLPAERRGETQPIRLARTHNELGRALRALQRSDEARDAHRQALAVLTVAPPGCAARPECRYELARTYYFQAQREPPGEPPGPPERGPGRGPDGFGRGRPPGPPPDRGPPGDGDRQASRRAIDLLEALVKDHANVPEYRHLLACCYRDAPPRGPRSVDATTDPAVKLLRQLVKDFPKVPDFRYDLAETLARMSMPVRPGRAEQDAAKKQLEEAVSLSRGLLDEYPTVPLYAVSLALAHDRLGELLEQTNQPEQSERHYRKAVALEANLLRQHPEVVAYDLTLSRIQRSLARVLADRKELTEARALLEASADRLDALLRKGPTQLERIRGSLGRTERDLAEVLTRLGEPGLAAKARRRADELGPDRRGGGPFGPAPR